MQLERKKWSVQFTLVALLAVLSLPLLFFSSGRAKGLIYWNVAQGLDRVGSKEAAREIEFESMCASMGWVRLQYTCRDEKEAQRLNSEIWELFNKTKPLPPGYHAEASATGDPAKLNVVVNKTARGFLEGHLRSKGFNPD